MKKVKKVIYITLLMMIILSIFTQIDVYAEETKAAGGSDIMSTITTMSTADAGEGDSAVTATKNIAGAVITIAKTVSAGVAIIMITVLAMKYMLAAPSEKADVKKHAVPYIVGAVIMFSVTGILTILQNFAKVFE